jgi:16S rRNA (cytosine1402-N4)-methyltransferase
MTGPKPSDPPRHIPVMPAEVLRYLAPQEGQIIVDATAGAGGHSSLILERLGATGRLVASDRDESMLDIVRSRLSTVPGARFHLMQANFDRLPDILGTLGIAAVDGVLVDLGVCSDQLDTAERGFSFQQEGPLDMRLNPQEGEPASSLLQRLPERDLADLFWKYGEDRYSRRIARQIVATRRREPLQTTRQLAELVRRCVPRSKNRRFSIDPATRVFQALRIAVNDELGSLTRLLSALPQSLKTGGRAVVISFHSLEDRLVKQAFRNRSVWEPLTPKPVQAGVEEQQRNPRARSAKLRAARKAEQATV